MQPEETPQTCRPHLRGVFMLFAVHVVYQCRIGLKVQLPGDAKMFREPPKNILIRTHLLIYAQYHHIHARE